MKGNRAKQIIRHLVSEKIELERKLSMVNIQPKQPHPFYDSREWRALRYRVFARDGRVCAVCGRKNIELHVDHIKPRSLFPDLELEINNLQILCKDCNLGKSNLDQTDWRTQ